MEDYYNDAKANTHKMTLTNRNICLLTGVKDVLSFDLHEVLLETECGMLSIKGNDLHVGRLILERGEIAVAGVIDSLCYSTSKNGGKKGESVLSRLFR